MNCDQLRSKIEHLEQMNPNTMSPTLQQTYREALLKLYLQLSQCEQDELAVLTEMRNTVAGTTAAASVEDRFQALSKEKTDTDNKITSLRAALNSRHIRRTAICAAA
jgi:uncharacterized protein YutE (UPF0331/DUF86 family)